MVLSSLFGLTLSLTLSIRERELSALSLRERAGVRVNPKNLKDSYCANR